MYCAVCGSNTNPKLNFCSACGERIERSGSIETKYQSTAMAAGAIGLGGLFITLILLLKLVRENIDITAVVVIAAMFLTAVVAMLFITIKMMPAMIEKRSSAEDYSAPPMLKAPDTARLEAARDTPASVVENTTRTLEEIPAKRS